MSIVRALCTTLSLGAVAFGVCSPATAGCMALMGVGKANCGGAPPPSTTTWNPSDSNANLLPLTNGNLTVTNNGSFAFNSIRAIASHSTGKFYYELTLTTFTSGADLIGIANATMALNNAPGNDPNGIGISATGNVTINSTTIGTGISFSAGAVIDIAMDITDAKIWYRSNGGALE